MSNSQVLSRKVDVSYALLAWPLAMLGIPLYLYLPSFLYENWQVSLSLIGLVLMLSRVIDLVTDPLIGFWSDRVSQRVSRVSQIAMGSLLLITGSILLFWPISSWLINSPFIYLFVALFLTFLGWSLISVPYQAMVAELTDSKAQITRIITTREAIVVLGIVSVLSLPFILNLHPTDPALFHSLLALLSLGLIISLGVMKLFVQPHLHLPRRRHKSGRKQLKLIWQQHRWSLRLMPIYFINSLANAIPATLFLLFVSYGLQLPEEAGLFLMIYFLSGLLALPAWFWLAQRYGKQQAWQISILLSIISFAGVFSLNPGDFYGYLIICILTGLSLGADMALPSAMQTDIAQRLSQTLNSVNGLLFGLWGMLTKLALALAVGIMLPLVDWLKMASDSPATQTHDTLWLLYAGLPIVLKLFALYHLKNHRLIQDK